MLHIRDSEGLLALVSRKVNTKSLNKMKIRRTEIASMRIILLMKASNQVVTNTTLCDFHEIFQLKVKPTRELIDLILKADLSNEQQ